MTKINDGGPAFPRTGGNYGHYKNCNELTPQTEKFHGPQAGMALRDWFAGMTLSGLLSNSSNVSKNPEEWARLCYLMADAMLKVREGGGE